MKKEKKKIIWKPTILVVLHDTFLETKCSRIKCKNILKGFPLRIPRFSIPHTIEQSWYLPIGAWLVINLRIHAHIKFERPKFFSQIPPLEYVGQISWLSSLFKSRKFLLLYSNAWNIICHLQTMSSHSSFWLNSHEDLQGRVLWQPLVKTTNRLLKQT